MEARLIRAAALAAVLLASMGARVPSANFIVETPDPKFAAQVAQAAETYRHDLAIDWLGEAMPPWYKPCQMTVRVGPTLGAGGATTFVFDGGEVYGWQMTIQGSAERILDSVLPHEVTHMIYASHFRRPLPRWADEGGATSVEHPSEKQKHRAMLVEFLHTGRGIAFNQMFAMKDYPRDVLPLYAQGYSLSEYLIMRGGRRKYVEYLGEGMSTGRWGEATAHHYGIADLSALQNTWLDWVKLGWPELKPDRGIAAPVMAVSESRRARPEANLLYHVRDKSAAPAAAPQALPADGWRPAAEAAPAGATAGPQAEQVSRPQPTEPSRQVILEWTPGGGR